MYIEAGIVDVPPTAWRLPEGGVWSQFEGVDVVNWDGMMLFQASYKRRFRGEQNMQWQDKTQQVTHVFHKS